MRKFKQLLTIVLSLSFFAALSQAKGVDDVLSPFRGGDHRTSEKFVIKSEKVEYQLHEHMQFDGSEVIDASYLLIAVKPNGSAKLIWNDVSLIGISAEDGVSQKTKEKLYLAYAEQVMEPSFGGRANFEAKAHEIIKNKTAEPDLLWIFEHYLGIK